LEENYPNQEGRLVTFQLGLKVIGIKAPIFGIQFKEPKIRRVKPKRRKVKKEGLFSTTDLLLPPN